MRLKNKKTGEIATLTLSSDGERFLIMKDNEMIIRDVKLSDLNEWEDYEELKEYWCIDWTGGINHITVLDDTDEYEENKKEIGNYFETKEEAEEAVEKLKAWEQLRQRGFKFEGWGSESNKSYSEIWFTLLSDHWDIETYEALDVLFGEENNG